MLGKEESVYRIRALVEGVGRGLLMHRFSVQAQAEADKKVKKTGEAANRSDPVTEAEQCCYRLDAKDGEPKGQLYLPAEHFIGAMVAAGSSFQVKGKGKKTYKDSVKGGIEVLPDFLPLTDSAGVGIYDYKIDSRPVRIQRGRVVRHRPFLTPGWRTEFVVEVADDNVPLEVVQSILEEAGKSKCVGDYRPRFGQFRIVSFERQV